MKLMSALPRCRSFGRLRLQGSVWLLLSGMAVRLLAAESYLPANHPDSLELLPPPPVTNSAEQAADLASARSVFKSTPVQEKTRAEEHAALTIFKFTPAIGDFFQPGKFPKMEQFMERVKISARVPINLAKDHWKRMRPYQLDAELKFGQPEGSFSYPSGHSAVGTVLALVLAELFPDQKEAILETGRQIGWDRVEIGKHFPTDIYAGRTLGQAIVRELKANPAFQHDFAEAIAEVKPVRSAASATK